MEMIDKKILALMQEEFPVCSDPYLELSEKLGISKIELFSRVKALYDAGYILKISPKYVRSSKAIKALIALKVEKELEDKIAEAINTYEEVSHNYIRDDEYSIWFTISTKSKKEFENIISEIQDMKGVKNMLILLSKKLYKLNVEFDVYD
ncbi:MAG: Lrp/AsnC family transcriptional regulator [Thermoplasmata archaeon]